MVQGGHARHGKVDVPLTYVTPKTDPLALAIAELDKRLNIRLDERDRRLDERFTAQQSSVERAAEALKQWQASANEWRGALSDLSGHMLTRDEYDRSHHGLIDKTDAQMVLLGQRMDSVSSRVDIIEGKSSGISASLSTILIIAGLAITIAIAFIHFAGSH